jgi:hypothetical protein
MQVGVFGADMSAGLCHQFHTFEAQRADHGRDIFVIDLQKLIAVHANGRSGPRFRPGLMPFRGLDGRRLLILAALLCHGSPGSQHGGADESAPGQAHAVILSQVRKREMPRPAARSGPRLWRSEFSREFYLLACCWASGPMIGRTMVLPVNAKINITTQRANMPRLIRRVHNPMIVTRL